MSGTAPQDTEEKWGKNFCSKRTLPTPTLAMVASERTSHYPAGVLLETVRFERAASATQNTMCPTMESISALVKEGPALSARPRTTVTHKNSYS